MNIYLDVLTDENLQFLVNSDLNLFIEPIKKNQKKYLQYTSLLGNMNKKSLLVQKNLPNIAVKLYKRQDKNYVMLMEAVAKNSCDMLLRLVNDTLEREVTVNEFCDFTNEQLAEMLVKFQSGDDNVLEIDLFKMQMKMIGFPNVDDRIPQILSLCGIEEKNSDVVHKGVIGVKAVSEENRTSSERRVKAKKLTSEEKAAKTRAVVEAKEKAKVVEVEGQESTSIAVKESSVGEMQKGKTGDALVEHSYSNISTDSVEEEKMSGYIGVVNIKSNFYNFTPIGVYENGTYMQYSENAIDELLPKSIKHNINFYYNYWDETQNKFMKEKFLEGYPMLLNCDIEELEENRTSDGGLNPTGYKIEAMDAWNKKKISPLSEMGLYAVLTKEELLDDITSKRAIRVAKEGLVEGEQVLVNLGDGFYAGPFSVKYSPTNQTLFIVVQAVEGKHFMYGYNASDCVRVIVEPSVDVENWIGGYNSWYYYTIKNNATRSVKDFISDRDLLESFKSTLEKSKELDYSNLDVNGIIEKIGSSQIIAGSSIPEEVREQRIDRIRRIMSSEETLVQVYAETSDLICELLLKNKDSKQTETLLADFIAKRPDLLETMPGVRAVQAKVDSVRAELEQLEAHRTEVEAKVKNIQESTVSTEAKNDNLDEVLSAELLAKKAELEEILERIGVAEAAIGLQDEVKRLEEEVTYYESHKRHLVNDTNNLRSKFGEFINGYSDKMADITFDGFMSSKMLQAAVDWEAKAQNEQLSAMVSTMNEYQSQELSGEELIDYLVKTVQVARPGYAKNTIINIFTCTAQGFLTVFSGMPGCGKTSICNIISKVLGLNSYDRLSVGLKDIHRFISVSVERGWTSKRDFIGYFNPLTKAFEESNRQVYDGLKFLDMEKRKGYSRWPFMILLDEANLSPMEYYWADFMNVCDDLNDNSSINLGNENIFQIPETLHFLATINNDHTTETLSPRLIDRAWVITLPKFSTVQFGHEIIDEQIKNVTWDDIKKVFTVAGQEKKNFDRETQGIYEGLKDKLSKRDLYVSPRVDIAIQKYWAVASKLMDEDEYGNSANLVALDYAIAQKVLPKIIGSGDDYEVWLEELKLYCDSKGLLHSAELLEAIIIRGNRQMKYYQFFN